MANGFSSIPLIGSNHEKADVELKTRVDKSQAFRAGRPYVLGEHQFESTNRSLLGRRLIIKSAITDAKIQYPDEDPTTEWPLTVDLNRKEKDVPRSDWLTHSTACPPRNGHAIRITVEVRSMYEDEQPLGGTELPFSLQFGC